MAVTVASQLVMMPQAGIIRDPKLTSIVIPAWLATSELCDLTWRCMQAIEKHTPQSHEVILVENGVREGLEEPAEDMGYEADVLIRFQENRGYGPAVNAGFALARGKYLVAMNNDAEVVEDWLSAMHGCWAAHPKVGAISAHITERDPQRTHLCNDATNQRRAMCGALWMTTQDVLADVGGLDEGYAYGMFEDRDFWERLYRSGYRLFKAGWCRHSINSTWKLLPNQQEIYLRNRKRFEEKWGSWPDIR